MAERETRSRRVQAERRATEEAAMQERKRTMRLVRATQRLRRCAGYAEVRLASDFCQRGQLPERRGSRAQGSTHLRLRASKQIDGVLLRFHARRGEVAVAHVVRVIDAQVGRLEHHGAAEQRGVARRSRPRAEPAQRRRGAFY